MKLNATTEMEPVTWPEFGGCTRSRRGERPRLRPLIDDLERWLCEITGYDA
jgi:glycine dehydrogenase